MGRLKEKSQDQEEFTGKLTFGRDFVLEEKDFGVNENHGFKHDCLLAILVYHLCRHYPYH